MLDIVGFALPAPVGVRTQRRALFAARTNAGFSHRASANTVFGTHDPCSCTFGNFSLFSFPQSCRTPKLSLTQIAMSLPLTAFGPYRAPTNDTLMLESVSLNEIAERYGTPCYVYSQSALLQSYQEYRDAFQSFDTLVCYAVKANANLSLLRLLAAQGAGFDIVSGGELFRVLQAGGDPRRIVFSGVAKSEREIDEALKAGILCFNVESAAELQRLSERATRLEMTAPISLRVNPEVDARTHPYIATGLRTSKFGVPATTALALYRKAQKLPHLKIVGIDCHIGSQITTLEPFLEATDKILELVHQLAAEGIPLEHIDLGGGVGICYRDEDPLSLSAYATALKPRFNQFQGRLLFEPGRRIVGNAGLLLTRVEYLKTIPERQLVIVDAGMNDLMRPSLYQAWHEIVPVDAPRKTDQKVDIVGPVCESSDVLGTGRTLDVQAGDLLAILSCGAYGASMSSRYNARPLIPEVLVHGSQTTVIRRRETYADLIQHELS